MVDRIKIKEIGSSKTNAVDRYNPTRRLYVRAVYGVYQKIRRYIGWGLILIFLLLPLLQWNGNQAILFDINKQQYHIFNMILFPQDLTLLAWVFIIAAFALFFFTTYLGRVWCGYACPQTVWTFIFIWFEERIEGTANKRKRLDQLPWNFNKIWRKTLKHVTWILFSLFTGIAFASYFVPVIILYRDFFTLNSSFATTASILFFASITYINAGFMRSIVCTHMCPYSRFQSAMFDKNTYIVGYDANRGEKRGARRRKDEPKALGLGDCIDCDLCVQVCPVAIDIRDGLQYECINCGACVDACNETMDRMKYTRDLISYTSEHKLEGNKTKVLRPKIIGYGLVLLLMCGVFLFNILNVSRTDMDVLRDRMVLYRFNSQGLIENTYTLKILNKTVSTQTYKISFLGLDHAKLIGPDKITIQSGEIFTQPIAIAVDPYGIKKSKVMITLKLINTKGNIKEIEEQIPFFLGS
ncbi:MAG: cytochrome c oxidase accessory protein CcoG [Psychromonas sp.]|nr:cytochrome c oxidase accessory protein CcoG [Psychromonas sp.]